MNKKLSLAVAGALVAFSSVANAGITIPAGDWTVDIGGNVNAFAVNTTNTGTGSAASSVTTAKNGVGTGLLPAQFGIGAKTRQNDLDIAFQFSFFTGTSQGSGTNSLNIRQAYLTFGDASWGTVLAGRNLGLYGSDVILSDMTLLGVGPITTASVGGNATYGHIGTGYQYADWLGQIAYTTPNFNGFQASVAVTEPYAPGTSQIGNQLGFQGKASYDFAANDVTGKVWVGGLQQSRNGAATVKDTKAYELGAKLGFAGAELVGYYYDGDALSSVDATSPTVYGAGGDIGIAAAGKVHDSKDSGGFVQATYKIPTIGTKVGVSWGSSNTKTNGDAREFESSAWTVGAYHPLTKSLSLVAEYSKSTQEVSGGSAGQNGKLEGNTVAAGAILFF